MNEFIVPDRTDTHYSLINPVRLHLYAIFHYWNRISLPTFTITEAAQEPSVWKKVNGQQWQLIVWSISLGHVSPLTLLNLTGHASKRGKLLKHAGVWWWKARFLTDLQFINPDIFTNVENSVIFGLLLSIILEESDHFSPLLSNMFYIIWWGIIPNVWDPSIGIEHWRNKGTYSKEWYKLPVAWFLISSKHERILGTIFIANVYRKYVWNMLS